MGVTTGMVANAGGILGCFVFSALATKFRSRPLLVLSLLGAALAYLVFSLFFAQISIAIVLAGLLGLLTNAGIAGFYSASPDIYSARARATGVGWMIGLGRLVSIVAPIAVGYLLAGGWEAENIFKLFTIPLAASALSIIALGYSLKRQTPQTSGLPPVAVS
ncbi:MFS family permease [Paeniglutamicibacter kerguelensis]|uniref:MFS family permease n=1 Tax=Paeniglutamicibacter kerguelensis TaxID=254788 RepID=A0ABS4XAJ5_9MICC|nr:MFS family permease [Paeniglutamicibacter kerguelensis]